ncbi:unnamed protein product [Brachionus calyciflorus]|uniref:Uncharacterized protein n=1 Tax=Brachionus calyciflorus TaxID=104777 RepID=A0A814NXX8_9BILA|nr:unnamed protein product [Brachionus calyciflorus]
MDSILRWVKYEKCHHSFYTKIEATKQAVVKTIKNYIKQSITQQKEGRIMANSMRAPSVFNLETNVDLWLARFDSYLEINRIFSDRDKIKILGSYLDDTTFKHVDSLVHEETYDEVKARIRNLFSRPETPANAYLHTFVGRYQELNESLVQFAAVLNDLGGRAFPDRTPRELDAFIRGQFMTVLRKRDKADKLAKMDIGDMETLAFRAREQEIVFLGFSGFGMWNRSQNQLYCFFF